MSNTRIILPFVTNQLNDVFDFSYSASSSNTDIISILDNSLEINNFHENNKSFWLLYIVYNSYESYSQQYAHAFFKVKTINDNVTEYEVLQKLRTVKSDDLYIYYEYLENCSDENFNNAVLQLLYSHSLQLQNNKTLLQPYCEIISNLVNLDKSIFVSDYISDSEINDNILKVNIINLNSNVQKLQKYQVYIINVESYENDKFINEVLFNIETEKLDDEFKLEIPESKYRYAIIEKSETTVNNLRFKVLDEYLSSNKNIMKTWNIWNEINNLPKILFKKNLQLGKQEQIPIPYVLNNIKKVDDIFFVFNQSENNNDNLSYLLYCVDFESRSEMKFVFVNNNSSDIVKLLFENTSNKLIFVGTLVNLSILQNKITELSVIFEKLEEEINKNILETTKDKFNFFYQIESKYITFDLSRKLCSFDKSRQYDIIIEKTHIRDDCLLENAAIFTFNPNTLLICKFDNSNSKNVRCQYLQLLDFKNAQLNIVNNIPKISSDVEPDEYKTVYNKKDSVFILEKIDKNNKYIYNNTKEVFTKIVNIFEKETKDILTAINNNLNFFDPLLINKFNFSSNGDKPLKLINNVLQLKIIEQIHRTFDSNLVILFKNIIIIMEKILSNAEIIKNSFSQFNVVEETNVYEMKSNIEHISKNLFKIITSYLMIQDIVSNYSKIINSKLNVADILRNGLQDGSEWSFQRLTEKLSVTLNVDIQKYNLELIADFIKRKTSKVFSLKYEEPNILVLIDQSLASSEIKYFDDTLKNDITNVLTDIQNGNIQKNVLKVLSILFDVYGILDKKLQVYGQNITIESLLKTLNVNYTEKVCNIDNSLKVITLNCKDNDTFKKYYETLSENLSNVDFDIYDCIYNSKVININNTRYTKLYDYIINRVSTVLSIIVNNSYDLIKTNLSLMMSSNMKKNKDYIKDLLRICIEKRQKSKNTIELVNEVINNYYAIIISEEGLDEKIDQIAVSEDKLHFEIRVESCVEEIIASLSKIRGVAKVDKFTSYDIGSCLATLYYLREIANKNKIKLDSIDGTLSSGAGSGSCMLYMSLYTMLKEKISDKIYTLICKNDISKEMKTDLVNIISEILNIIISLKSYSLEDKSKIIMKKLGIVHEYKNVDDTINCVSHILGIQF